MTTLQISLIVGAAALVGAGVCYALRKRRPWAFCLSVFIVCAIFAALSLLMNHG